MILTCARLTPALDATASLAHGLGEISEHLADATKMVVTDRRTPAHPRLSA